MNKVLAISARPKSFKYMIGASKVTSAVLGHINNGREPNAWLFIGSTGAGKTTIARIMALSYQCTHNDFGDPCPDCYAQKAKYDITEVNASDDTGVADFRSILSGAIYGPKPGSQRKVFILDELHKASNSAQNYMLKPFEDCPATTVFICCTSTDDKIIPALKRRCTIYTMPKLEMDDIRKLVKRIFKKTGSTRSSDELVEAILESNISTSGLVLNAVEKFLASPTCTAEEAVRVEYTTTLDIYALNRAIFRGNWRAASEWLKKCNPEDVRLIKGKLSAYLRTILLDDQDFSERNRAVSEAIKELTKVNYNSDETQLATIAAVAYDLSEKFKGFTKP